MLHLRWASADVVHIGVVLCLTDMVMSFSSRDLLRPVTFHVFDIHIIPKRSCIMKVVAAFCTNYSKLTETAPSTNTALDKELSSDGGILQSGMPCAVSRATRVPPWSTDRCLGL